MEPGTSAPAATMPLDMLWIRQGATPVQLGDVSGKIAASDDRLVILLFKFCLHTDLFGL